MHRNITGHITGNGIIQDNMENTMNTVASDEAFEMDDVSENNIINITIIL